MRVSVVLVHYHAAQLAVEAFEALERDLEAANIKSEWVVVDNGSRPEERDRLAALPVDLVDPGENLGYAGGANLGVRRSEAPFVILMNPDVIVLPGCAAALLKALADGAAVAGPRFFWDRERRFLLPPTERRTRRDELIRVLGERSQRWAGVARRRWRRHAWRFWEARQPYRCHELSGALLAFERRTWELAGGFDEGYRLYFEETDWLERLRGRNAPAWFVPAAEAIHLYAQSTVGEPRAEGWFAESHGRFRRRFYGAAWASMLEFLGRSWRPGTPEVREFRRDFRRDGRTAWLEVSMSACGYPAAGRRLTESSPRQAHDALPAGTWYLRTVDASGRELELAVVRQGGGPP